MKATLDQSAIRIAHAAAGSDLDSRPILQCVRIGDGKIIACDGFMLAVRTILTEPETGETILIDARALLGAQKLLGNKLVVESQGKESAVIRREKGGNLTISVNLLHAEYPKYKQILPTTEKKAYTALDISLMAKTLKAADRENSLVLKIKLREPTTPIEIVTGKTKIYIMPMAMPEEGSND